MAKIIKKLGRPQGSLSLYLSKIELVECPSLGTDCWVLPLKVENNGYTRVRHNGKRELVHRAFYKYFKKKEIVDGLIIDHKCRRRNCINDNHLEEVTYSINNKRGAKFAPQYLKKKSDERNLQ